MLGLEATLWSNGPQPFWHQFSPPWGGGGFGMIQARTFIVHFISITSAPSQMIRHQVPEVGDPCLEDPQDLPWGQAQSMREEGGREGAHRPESLWRAQQRGGPLCRALFGNQCQVLCMHDVDQRVNESYLHLSLFGDILSSPWEAPRTDVTSWLTFIRV